MEYYPNHILFEFALQAFRIDGRLVQLTDTRYWSVLSWFVARMRTTQLGARFGANEVLGG